MRSVGVSLGVTGPPSFADRAQRTAHRMMWRYTDQPVGWETQVCFEPGVIVTAQQRWLLFSAQIGGIRLLDAVVGTAASVGQHPDERRRRRGPPVWREPVASVAACSAPRFVRDRRYLRRPRAGRRTKHFPRREHV